MAKKKASGRKMKKMKTKIDEAVESIPNAGKVTKLLGNWSQEEASLMSFFVVTGLLLWMTGFALEVDKWEKTD